VSAVLVLWLATPPPPTEILEAGGSGVRVVHCTLAEVTAHALAPNALIAVVDDDHVATETLEAVVDKVLRRSELTEETFARAAEAAEGSANKRELLRDRAPRLEEADAMEAFLEWLAIELVACVSGAALEAELLEDDVRRLVARERPGAHLRERVPRAEDTLEMLETVHESFRRLREVLEAVRVLSGADASNAIGLASLLQSLERILRSRALPIADLFLDVDAACATTTRPGKLVAALVLLAHDVLDRATRLTPDRRVRVTLRAYALESAAAIELEHDLDPSSDDARAGASALAFARRVLGGEGGEVHLARVSGKTILQLLLPLAEASGVVVPRPARPVRGSRMH
jgi:hypothetical protein